MKIEIKSMEKEEEEYSFEYISENPGVYKHISRTLSDSIIMSLGSGNVFVMENEQNFTKCGNSWAMETDLYVKANSEIIIKN